MPDNAQERITPPFQTFNFSVEITVPGLNDDGGHVCSAVFSECSGLEWSMAPKTIREGGNNRQPIHLLGPVSYSQLMLKRGMSSNFDLWHWFDMTTQLGKERTRGSGEVVLLAEDGEAERIRFSLKGCLPVKLRAPALNAATGGIAIEELQLAYESLTIKEASAS